MTAPNLVAKYNSLLDLVPEIVDNVWASYVSAGWAVSVVIIPHECFATDLSAAIQRELLEANIHFDTSLSHHIGANGSYDIYISATPSVLRGRAVTYLYIPTLDGFNDTKREELEYAHLMMEIQAKHTTNVEY